jgi:transposase
MTMASQNRISFRAGESGTQEETRSPHVHFGIEGSRHRNSDPDMFRSGRDFSAWLGMTSRQNSSAARRGATGVSERGDKYVRRLLVGGAIAVIRHARRREPSTYEKIERGG